MASSAESSLGDLRERKKFLPSDGTPQEGETPASTIKTCLSNERVAKVTRFFYRVVVLLLLIGIGIAIGISAKHIEQLRYSLVSPPQCGPPCPRYWIGYEGKCYHFSREKRNWFSSQDHCSLHNASLAKIEKEEMVRCAALLSPKDRSFRRSLFLYIFKSRQAKSILGRVSLWLGSDGCYYAKIYTSVGSWLPVRPQQPHQNKIVCVKSGQVTADLWQPQQGVVSRQVRSRGGLPLPSSAGSLLVSHRIMTLLSFRDLMKSGYVMLPSLLNTIRAVEK